VNTDNQNFVELVAACVILRSKCPNTGFSAELCADSLGAYWTLGRVRKNWKEEEIIGWAAWAQPHFQSWGSNSLVEVIVQNKIQMVYPVSWTAVCCVTVITLHQKSWGGPSIFFGGAAPRPRSGCAVDEEEGVRGRKELVATIDLDPRCTTVLMSE